jgi:hypothetical protein
MSDDIDAKPDAPFALSREDLGSVTWRRLQEHMEAQLAKLRRRNDKPDLDAVATAHVRGQIKATLDLLALGTPNPVVAAHEEQDE